MKKVVVLGIAAFIVSLAAATGLGLMLRKPSAEEAPASHPVALDQEQHAEESGPFLRPPSLEPPAEPAIVPLEDPVQPAPERKPEVEDSTVLQSAGGEPAVADAPVDPQEAQKGGGAEAKGAEGVEYRQFAKVLASMKATQAAEIMGYLSDDQAEGILRSLGTRQVAALLSAMPIERAAILSRRMLEHPMEGE